MKTVKLSTLKDNDYFHIAGVKHQVCHLTPLAQTFVPHNEVLTRVACTCDIWSFSGCTKVEIEG